MTSSPAQRPCCPFTLSPVTNNYTPPPSQFPERPRVRAGAAVSRFSRRREPDQTLPHRRRIKVGAAFRTNIDPPQSTL